jgi:protein MpaA
LDRRTILLLLLALAGGCSTADDEGVPPETSDPIVREATPEPLAPAPVVEASTLREIGHSVLGKPIVAETFGRSGPVCLLLATIHGNEWAGTPLFEKLALKLHAEPALSAHRRIILVSVVNPDGYEKKTRTNVRNVDLNRNFDTLNFKESTRHGAEALSEPESRAIADLISTEKPALIVSMHQPLACLDWDGDAEAVARAMAESAGLPAKKLGTRPGSLGAWAEGATGAALVTFELRPRDHELSADELWAKYGGALLIAIESVSE